MDYDPAYQFRMMVLHNVDPYFYNEVPEFDPPRTMYAERLHTAYHALLDSCTPPEPAEITQASQVSAWMLAWGAPDTGRDIGRSVQRWRDAARGVGEARLRETLLSIEARMK